ncbi:MAG: hypothetical protein K1X28_08320 [Parachlamydiales bacterium]|nr:hypothetical protein [Parachlamydiales bacterium]
MSLIEAYLSVTDFDGFSYFSVEYKTGKSRVPPNCLNIDRVAATILKDDIIRNIRKYLVRNMPDVVVKIEIDDSSPNLQLIRR